MKAKVKRERRITPMSHGLMPHGNFRRSRDEKLNLPAHVAHRFELAIGNNDTFTTKVMHVRASKDTKCHTEAGGRRL